MSKEKSKDKTCGECRFHHQEYHYCTADKERKKVDVESLACENFVKKIITNGDIIRDMTNEEMATIWSELREQAFKFTWCYDCKKYCKNGNTAENRLKCKKRMLNYLNAPAGYNCFEGE